MRLLLLACFLGFAAADFLQDADTAVDENVIAFFQGAVKAGSLSQALGVNDPEVDQIGEHLESELGKKIREALKEILLKIRDHVENGKAAGHDLAEKVTHTYSLSLCLSLFLSFFQQIPSIRYCGIK
ncbi:hypothetical protein HNY73_014959 [Argiope bruennichi]|uniref:Uncharacterized protein n=1 Tax=Argiope bruennichi TaxID=94029 RepID=A0A8T0ER58_ARGBR|nr:hypothetical protein HNY73_014959 [Argiope bruennichi]